MLVVHVAVAVVVAVAIVVVVRVSVIVVIACYGNLLTILLIKKLSLW